MRWGNLSEIQSAAAHCLKLPGKNLHLTPLNNAKRFRNFGYKKGAMKAFEELQMSELGTLETVTNKNGAVSCLYSSYSTVTVEPWLSEQLGTNPCSYTEMFSYINENTVHA